MAKVVALEPDGAALAQLKAAGYAERYRDRGEPIYLIDVEFSRRDKRAVVGFAAERPDPRSAKQRSPQ